MAQLPRAAIFQAAAEMASCLKSPDGNFYGTTVVGGIGGNGVVFKISVGLPHLTPRNVSIVTNDASFGFTNGGFGFDLTGTSGSRVIIQGSTDLTNWIPLQTNSFGTNPLYFFDPQAPSNPHQFYRAMLPAH
jgi:uncharacterized repeat protein (TIGR03803 family)